MAKKVPGNLEASNPDADDEVQINEIASLAAQRSYEWLLVSRYFVYPIQGAIHESQDSLVADAANLKEVNGDVLAVFYNGVRLSEKEIRKALRPPKPTPAGKKSHDHATIDFVKLRSDLEAGGIHWKEALGLLQSPSAKPWKTAQWKRERDLRIGNQCAQCGTEEGPFVLQHTWHPTKLVDLFKSARAARAIEWLQWRQLNPMPRTDASLPPDTNACPKCGSTNILFRKKVANWICRSSAGGAKCGEVFATPQQIISRAAAAEAQKACYLAYRDRFDDESGVGKTAVLRSIEEHLRYVSLEDTQTYCKRCAYKADMLGKVLCRVCGEHYHAEKYPTCFRCAQSGRALPVHPIGETQASPTAAITSEPPQNGGQVSAKHQP
jgi:hypothetical protein